MSRNSFIVALLLSSTALAAPQANNVRIKDNDVVTVDHRSSKRFRVNRGVTRVAQGSGDIIDVAFFPPESLLITGKKLGASSVTLFYDDETVTATVSVVYPTAALLATLREALPSAKDLKADASGTALILSGEVTSAGDAVRAEEIAKGFVGQGGGSDAGSIVNLIKVTGDQQVQLEVSFAEVSRTALRQLGFNFWGRGNADGADINGALSSPGGGGQTVITHPVVQPPVAFSPGDSIGRPSIGLPITGAFGLLFSLGNAFDFPVSATLSVLSGNGYARVLAEPTLVALSGQEASFLAGGEFPIALPSSFGQVQVDWKKFGVQLRFVPTLVDDTIQLRMATTVSDVDLSLGIKLASVTVPGLTSRYSETTVRLRDGQNFAIAGLLSDKVRSNVDKIPGLGDIPVLGTLFRSLSYRREETELLVVVTARIVRPQGERPALPGELNHADPNDLELFFLGAIEPRMVERPAPAKAPSTGAPAPVAALAPRGPVGFARPRAGGGRNGRRRRSRRVAPRLPLGPPRGMKEQR